MDSDKLNADGVCGDEISNSLLTSFVGKPPDEIN